MTTFYTGQCTTKTYVKADGSCACGFYLERGLTYKQATDKCKSLGAKIPEIKNAQENADIFSIKVISHNIHIQLNLYSTNTLRTQKRVRCSEVDFQK
jgi:hypothetical protein